MAKSDKPLALHQFQVLQWIADDCPAGVYDDGFSHRITARRLSNSALVRITGQGKTWKASITPKGREVLARPEPQPDTPSAGEGLELYWKVEAAGGKLDLNDDVEKKLLDRVIRAFLKDEARPEGKRLSADYYGGYNGPIWAKVSIEDHLEDFVTRPTVVVSDSVSKYHPAVRQFIDDKDWHFMSKEQVPRAARIMQAFILECEHQGWTVEKVIPIPNRRWEDKSPHVHDGQFILKTLQTTVHLLIREIPAKNAPEVPDTVRYAMDDKRIPWTWGRIREFVPTGRLEITEKTYSPLVVRDGQRGKLEDLIPDLIVAIGVQDMERRLRREADDRAQQNKQQRWEAAMNSARVAFRQDVLLDTLNRQAQGWDRWSMAKSYLDSLEAKLHELSGTDRIQMKGWITESRAVNDMQNPYDGAPRYPDDREPTSDELKPYLKGWSPYGPGSIF